MKKEYVTKTLDSHKWDDYVPKDGDIVVATYYKVSARAAPRGCSRSSTRCSTMASRPQTGP